MDNIRTESFLGGNKVIIGNKYTDLVLETLGKVYIKTGNNSRVLSDVLELLDKTPESKIKKQTIIVKDLLEMEQMEYPGDGFFIYNTLAKTLYISYNERYLALIESTEGTGYVKRTGDVMIGQLEINTVSPPLIVASSKLVKNLNVEFVGGYAADDLTKKRVDEYITGNWTFKGKGVSENNWTFNQNVRMYGDLVTSGSLTSPEFASGFGGYGWKLDADTNTLTVDYLVVRKAMKIYEMVINKISATNGSLWVSNSSKCTAAYQPKIITQANLQGIGTWGTETAKSNLEKLMPSNNYYLFNDLALNYKVTEPLTSQLTNPNGDFTPKSFVDYNFIIYIKDIKKVISNPLFKGVSSLYDLNILDKTWEEYHTANPTGVSETVFNNYRGNIKLIYITKVKDPISKKNVDSFNKRTQFFVVPKKREAFFRKNGKRTGATPNMYGILPYYKYFGLVKPSSGMPTKTNIWIVECKGNEYPYFTIGDIVRCQKYNNGNIKYYDAVVTTQIDSYTYIMQKATSVFDTYTKMSYDINGNLTTFESSFNNTQYNKTEQLYNANINQYEAARTTTPNNRLDNIANGDDMIHIGSISNIERQNSIYITSTDDNGPYLDVLSGVNIPEYSSLYITPTWATKKVNISKKNGIYTREGVSNFYFQTANPKSVNPFTFTGTVDKLHPLIFLRTKDTESILINDGVVNQITAEILNNPAQFGYFLTEVPTIDSVLVFKNKEYKYNYTKTTKVRLGNLSGIHNELFGNKQPYGYGLYGENVFLTGEFYLNNGTSVVDFSEDKILLKFKDAGLEIRDVSNGNTIQVPALDLQGNPILDSNGKPVLRNKTEIYMNADQFKFSIHGKPAVSLNGLFDTSGKLSEAYLDIQGWIQSNGLYVYPKSFTPNPNNPKDGAVSYITDNGQLVSNDALFTNCKITGQVIAKSGKIGRFDINDEGLYYGDINKWHDNNYIQNMAYVSPGMVRVQRQFGYVTPGDLGYTKVGIGDFADPDVPTSPYESGISSGYFYRKMNTFGDNLLYYPAVKIISDNVIKRDVALYTKGAIVCHGGLIESAYIMNANTENVIDISLGSTVYIKNNVYQHVYLPQLSKLRAAVQHKLGEEFCVKVTIILSHDSTEDIYVTFLNNETDLYFLNNDGNYYDRRVRMGRGDVLELALIYSNNKYFAQLITKNV